MQVLTEWYFQSSNESTVGSGDFAFALSRASASCGRFCGTVAPLEVSFRFFLCVTSSSLLEVGIHFDLRASRSLFTMMPIKRRGLVG